MNLEEIKLDMGDLRSWKDPHQLENDPVISLIDDLQDAKHRGFLRKNELVKIAKLKSPRRHVLTQDNNARDVEAITELAFDLEKIQSESTRVSLICSLSGVRTPTASCVLAWVFPETWPVIDQRAWRALAAYNLVDGKKAQRLNSKDYAHYVSICRQIAKDKHVSPQIVDRWLYAADSKEG
ncbi:hypothetical protein [Roseovarius sp.]|uniref:hypothetical protein n=1 Tax=Roseovarius sp. TaxID=1486281 RepID=UPI003D0DDA5C